jgi:flagellar biogenesis protein FliO
MVVSALAAWQPSLSLVSALAAQDAGTTGAAAQAMPGQGYGELLMMSLGMVAMIGVLAVVAVKVMGRGRLGGRRGDLLEVIARQPLEPRRSLYVVRAGRRRLLVGTSELGVTMLTELDAADLDAADASDGLDQAGGRRGAGSLGFAELVREATRRWSGRKAGKAATGAKRVGDRGAGDGGPPELGPS